MCHASKVFIQCTVIYTLGNKAQLLEPNRNMLKPQNINLNFKDHRVKPIKSTLDKERNNSFSKETLHI